MITRSVYEEKLYDRIKNRFYENINVREKLKDGGILCRERLPEL